jgi:hypothetical protein
VSEKEKPQELPETFQGVAEHTFLIYESRSGEIVHGHKAVILPFTDAPSVDQLEREALELAADATGQDPGRLTALRVKFDELTPGERYRVNPDTHRLEPAPGVEKMAD